MEFMGLWEQIHNPDFDVTEFRNIENESGSNGFILSGKNWISKTNAIGIISKPGRYGGNLRFTNMATLRASIGLMTAFYSDGLARKNCSRLSIPNVKR